MIVNEFGDFVARTTSVPQDVAAAVKIRLLDVLASALAGYRLGNHRMVLSLIDGSGAATVWGDGRKLAARDAALVNSFVAHSTYLEDGSRYTGGHPSSALIPAAFALAEARGLSGRDLITAIAVGYEVFLRLGRGIFPETVKRGFQSTAVLAAVGSAAACANLLRADRVTAKDAIAIACTLGVGLKEALKSSQSQPLQVGRSCEGGLMAAMFAREGAVGADTIIENGFVKAFGGTAPEDIPLDGLGDRFSITETYLKLHGGCRGVHAPVDVVRSVVAENRITNEEIRSISIGIASVTLANDIHEPTTGDQAQFSAAFAVAASLLRGSASTFEFTDANLADPQIRDLMRRVSVGVDPELDAAFPHKRGACAEIVTRDGERHRGRIDGARGEPEFPLSDAEVREKFMDIASRVLGPNAAPLCDMVLSLETMPAIPPLLAPLTHQPS